MIARHIRAMIDAWYDDPDVPYEKIVTELSDVKAWVDHRLSEAMGTVKAKPLVDAISTELLGKWEVEEVGGCGEGRRYVYSADVPSVRSALDLENEWVRRLIALDMPTVAFVLTLNPLCE